MTPTHASTSKLSHGHWRRTQRRAGSSGLRRSRSWKTAARVRAKDAITRKVLGTLMKGTRWVDRRIPAVAPPPIFGEDLTIFRQ
jgi:hypothetical protein